MQQTINWDKKSLNIYKEEVKLI